MAIYISGMEMPKEGECFTIQIFRLNGEVVCTELYCADTYPVIELPPHGDLIDRCDIKNKEITIDYDEWDDTFEDGLLFVTNLIDNAPIIIPAEKGE